MKIKFKTHNHVTAWQRRGVSQIIGALFMLAIVAALGSVLVFTALNNIADFNALLSAFGINENESFRESLIIEHVRFTPDDDDLNIWIRNTGTNEVTIATVTMVKVDTQDLIINDNDKSTKIFPTHVAQIHYSSISLPGDNTWDGQHNGKNYKDSQYRISVTTARGNSFDSVVQPFNT